MKEIIGNKYNHLLVIERAEDYIRKCDGKHRPMYKCLCDCGKTKVILGRSIVNGTTKSCRCLIGKNLYKNGCSNKERLYTTWNNIKLRCSGMGKNNKKYYYDKNIYICKEWANNYMSFRNWALNNGYNDTLTIDRIDNSKGYEPDNCRFVNRTEQANNKTNNFIVYYKGEKYTLAQLSKMFNIAPNTIRRRIYLGWDIDRTLNEPVFIGKNQYYKKTRTPEEIAKMKSLWGVEQ